MRGSQVGRRMLRALVEAGRQQGMPCVVLDAQHSAIGFYLREGFVPEGATFMEAGIAHQRMQRPLGPA